MKANLVINSELNGIEIGFDSIPTTETRESLKANGFRWHKVKKVWYAKHTEERMIFANSLDGLEITENDVKKSDGGSSRKFDFDVKVGDLFYCSWGYEQTNVDFFQVVALVGTKSVRVKEVRPILTNENAVSSMSSDRVYKVTGEMLPVVERSIFITDTEKGDLKRLKSYSQDAFHNPIFEIGRGGYLCYKYTGQTVYESWYY